MTPGQGAGAQEPLSYLRHSNYKDISLLASVVVVGHCGTSIGGLAAIGFESVIVYMFSMCMSAAFATNIHKL